MTMGNTEGAGDGLASRLNKLFDVIRGQDMPPLSNAAAAAAITEKTGVSIKADALQQLRDGSETCPPIAYLKAIAEFFGVPASYLTDHDLDPTIDAQLNLLQALRDNRVRNLTLCPSTKLSPQVLNTLTATIASLSSHCLRQILDTKNTAC